MRKAVLLICTIFVLFLSKVNAKGYINKFWVQGSFGGFASTISKNGFCSSLSGSIIHKKYILTYRSSFFIEQQGWFMWGGRPNEHQRNYAFLIGKNHSLKSANANYSIGLGLTKGEKIGNYLYTTSGGGFLSFGEDIYERNYYKKASIPIEVNFNFNPFKYAALSFTLFTNLNTERNFFGATIGLNIGKFEN